MSALFTCLSVGLLLASASGRAHGPAHPPGAAAARKASPAHKGARPLSAPGAAPRPLGEARAASPSSGEPDAAPRPSGEAGADPPAGEPASAGPTRAPSPSTPGANTCAEAGSERAYDDRAAACDVELVLTDTGRGYLRARGRLSRHPEAAIHAIHGRLSGAVPPGPAARKRLLDVLAAFGRPEDLRLVAQELRRTLAATDEGRQLEVAAPWRNMLRAAGPRARLAFSDLVGARDLPVETRAGFLGDLVDVTAPGDLPELIALLGRGDPTLQAQLRRALAARAHARPADARALARALDDQLDRAAPARLGILLRVRAQLPGANDALLGRAAALAHDDAAPFGARVSALRVLAQARERPVAHDALLVAARTHLAPARRRAQASEILGWIAAQALPETEQRALARELDLASDPAPRLSALAVRVLPPQDTDALLATLEHPWPQVRAAALQAWDAPCDTEAMRALAARAGAPDHGGDADDGVARAAAAALGRCASPRAHRLLVRLLEDERARPHRRANAARALVGGFGPEGAERVAAILASAPPEPLARRLAQALGRAPRGTEAALQALCHARSQDPRVAAAARDALRARYGGSSACP